MQTQLLNDTFILVKDSPSAQGLWNPEEIGVYNFILKKREIIFSI